MMIEKCLSWVWGAPNEDIDTGRDDVFIWRCILSYLFKTDDITMRMRMR